ncbi:MAG: HD domain-containing protein [Candidatus Bathyarchaeota archaeon]|nr:MAG: HD domain-containing protein [Candidatus Bathyarchaeota archaeon]
MDNTRLQHQMKFLLEIDRLKRVLRQIIITDQSRQENSAEHSWHIALMTIILSEYAEPSHIDAFRVVKMLLVHDLVEIDAGDTYCYDDQARENQHERERQAAKRIFKLLPKDQAYELQALWEEFEARKTLNARFANALDRLQPLMSNYFTDGKAWQKHGVKRHQVVARNCSIEDGAPELWQYASRLIEDAVVRGILAE